MVNFWFHRAAAGGASPDARRSVTAEMQHIAKTATACPGLHLGNHSTRCNVQGAGKLGNWGIFRMPYYSFDLVIGEECRNQGGLILEDLGVASDRAEQLATELGTVRPELKTKGCAVRVTDSDNKELYRTPLDPIPAWIRRQLL